MGNMGQQDIIIREIVPRESPSLHSQILNLRNELLRIPIGLDLFQEDLSQEASHLTFAAIVIIPVLAKLNDNNVAAPTSNFKEIDKDYFTNNNDNRVTTGKNDKTITVDVKEWGTESNDNIKRCTAEGRLQLGKEEEKVVGCVLLAPSDGDEKTFKLRQMAVSPDFQGLGIGSKLVSAAENFAKQQGKTRIYLNGRKHAVPFYLKQGYNKVSDEEFLELGIPHYALEKMLL